MKLLFNLILALLGAILIFLLVYLLGWDLLTGYLAGNDMGMAYTAGNWLNHYFPAIPQWFPNHGLGVSLVQGNQIGAPYLSVLTSRILGITLAQSMHLWSFLSIYLTALGIFIFVRIKFQSWSAAFLAGLFYPLSDASWAWLTEIGLYANGLAFMFFPPTILTLDLLLSELTGAKRERRVALWFVFSCFFATLALLIHFTVGTVLIETIVVYGLIFSIATHGRKLTDVFLGLVPSILVILTAILLAAFWFFPFLRYIHLVSRNLLPAWSFEQIPYATLDSLFGFSGLKSLSQNNEMWYVFFARPVWILALIGLIMAFWRKNKTAIALSLSFVFFVFYAVAPGIVPWLVKALLIFWRDIYVRSLIPAIIFLPVLAAWGCLAMGQSLAKFIPKINLTAFFTLIFAGLFLVIFQGGSANEKLQSPCYAGFGRFWRTDIDLCHFWEKLGKINLSLSSQSAVFSPFTKDIAEKLNLSSKDRIDISPKQGGLIGAWSITSETQIATLYWYALALNNIFWGYEMGLFYDDTYVDPKEAIPEMASYFGLKHLLLNKEKEQESVETMSTDTIWKYDARDWEVILDDPEKNLLALGYKNATDLVTWTNRPTVLVIGNRKKQAYEQFFRRATAGVLSYNQALLVEGRDDGRLDKYTFEELKKFDALVLYGQVYEEKEKVNKLLSQYVKDGGRVFIESGWQYTNSEWQAHQTLDIIPIQKLAWDKGQAASLKLDSTPIGGQFDQEKFGTFVYYKTSWDVTTAPIEEVKDWGKVVYQRNDKPIIIVGNLGQGRVVWSGMNLIGHLQFWQAREEFNFAKQLFDWLLEGKDKQDFAVSYTRPNPDKVEFTFKEDTQTPTFLLWRENYHPDWQASLGSGKILSIYRAGPNLMLLRVPSVKKGDKIILEFKLTIFPLVSKIISIVIFIILLVFLAVPRVFSAASGLGKGFLSRFSQNILEDEVK